MFGNGLVHLGCEQKSLYPPKVVSVSPGHDDAGQTEMEKKNADSAVKEGEMTLQSQEPQPEKVSVQGGGGPVETKGPQLEKVQACKTPQQVEETPEDGNRKVPFTPQDGIGDGKRNEENRFQSPSLTPVPPTERASDAEEEGVSEDEDMLPPPPQLTKGAIDARMRRVMAPRADGTFVIPEVAREMYKDKSKRGSLMALFEKCAYEPVPCPNLNLKFE